MVDVVVVEVPSPVTVVQVEVPGLPGRPAGLRWNFSALTADADPGPGDVRFNNATIGSVTFLYFDNVDAENNTQTAWLNALDDNGGAANKGVLYIYSEGSNAFMTFRINGSVVDGGGYKKVPVLNLTGALPADNSVLDVVFAPSGDAGAVSGPGSSTDRAIATWNGTAGTALRDNPAATINANGGINMFSGYAYQTGASVFPFFGCEAVSTSGDPEFYWYRARGTGGVPVAVAASDFNGIMAWLAHNGTQYERAASLEVSVQDINVTGSGNHPSDSFLFKTRAVGDTGINAVTGTFGIVGGTVNTIDFYYGKQRSRVADGASAIGFEFNTLNTLATAGAKLASFKNNTVEKSYVDLNGKVVGPAGAAASASFNAAHGAAPTSPVNGDFWTTTAALFVRLNGVTQTIVTLAGGTFTGEIVTVASATSSAGLNIPHGAAPTAPVNGDFWSTTAALFVRLNGTTQTVMTLAGGTMTGKISTVASASGSAGLGVPHGAAPSAPVDGDFWSTTANFFVRINGATKTVAVLESPAFTGTPTAPTATAGDSSTQIATTAFVNTETQNAQTGTTYTFVLSDIGKMVSGNNAAAITFTIPTNATTAFPIGTRIDVLQLGAGQITIGGAGVTIRSLGSLVKTSGQYAGLTLWKQATDTWHLFGQLG